MKLARVLHDVLDRLAGWLLALVMMAVVTMLNETVGRSAHSQASHDVLCLTWLDDVECEVQERTKVPLATQPIAAALFSLVCPVAQHPLVMLRG